MPFAPPWLSSDFSFSTLLSHPYLHVTSGPTDANIWTVVLVFAFLVAVQRMLRRSWLQGLLGLVGCLWLLFSSTLVAREEASIVFKSSPEQVMALALGCKEAELTEKGCQGGQELAPEQINRLKVVAIEVAKQLNDQECVYVGASVNEIVACPSNIPPTPVRKVFSFVAPKIPSNFCQDLEISSKLTHKAVTYQLPDGGYAVGLQERSSVCYNAKKHAMEFVENKDLWQKDLDWLLNSKSHR